jgi:hypothetical protein
MPYLNPFLFIAPFVLPFKLIYFPWQSQIITCILSSSQAWRPSEFAWLFDTSTYRRYESCWTGRSGSYFSSDTLLSPPTNPIRNSSFITSSQLLFILHSNNVSLCNVIKYHRISYAITLSAPWRVVGPPARTRFGLRYGRDFHLCHQMVETDVRDQPASNPEVNDRPIPEDET